MNSVYIGYRSDVEEFPRKKLRSWEMFGTKLLRKLYNFYNVECETSGDRERNNDALSIFTRMKEQRGISVLEEKLGIITIIDVSNARLIRAKRTIFQEETFFLEELSGNFQVRDASCDVSPRVT